MKCYLRETRIYVDKLVKEIVRNKLSSSSFVLLIGSHYRRFVTDNLFTLELSL